MTIKLTSRDIGIDAETPDDCKSLGDVRQAIDTIDKQIIQLLGMRKGYVLSAAQFKETAEAIPAPERVAAMLKARQCWSKEYRVVRRFHRALIRTNHSVVYPTTNPFLAQIV